MPICAGSVQGLKRKGEEELFRVGPERSVVMRFSSFAFDDPRYPAEYPCACVRVALSVAGNVRVALSVAGCVAKDVW